jgi:putative ABC transport system permease protein
VTESIRGVPGVITASATSALPLAGGGVYLWRVFLRENQPEPPASADTQAAWSVVQPGYFATMGMPIVEGRAFTAQDAANSTQVIIISRAMAKEMFPDGRPLGRRIRSWRDENRYREIVGVVGDLRHNGLAANISNNVYVPHTQRPWNALTVVVRTSTDPLTLLPSVRSAIWLVDKKLPLASVQTMEQVRDTEMARPRLTMRSRPSAPMASWPTPLCSARVRSASGWRSARSGLEWWPWLSGRRCGSRPSAWCVVARRPLR